MIKPPRAAARRAAARRAANSRSSQRRRTCPPRRAATAARRDRGGGGGGRERTHGGGRSAPRPGRSVAGRPGPVSTVSEQAVGGGGEFPRGVLKIPHLRPASVDRPAFDRRSLQARPDPVAIPRWGRAGAAGTATSWLGPPNLAGS